MSEEYQIFKKWRKTQGPGDKTKGSNSYVTNIQGEEKYCGAGKTSEDILTENIPNLAKDTMCTFQKLRETYPG